jgi:DNA-binding response OmpR family regulator
MPKKVLVVDDEKQIAKLVALSLTRAGYEVIVAHDGDEALQMIEQEEPDILVIDDFMAKMSGPDVMRKLREDPKRLGDDRGKIIIIRPRVITLWQRTNAAASFESWELGSSHALTKPFNPKDLLGLVARATEEIDAQKHEERG